MGEQCQCMRYIEHRRLFAEEWSSVFNIPQALTSSGNVFAMVFDRGGKIMGGVLFGTAFFWLKFLSTIGKG